MRYIGKKTKAEAQDACLKMTDGKWQLPFPRFSEEMDFYRTLFDDLWLDVTRNADGLLESIDGHIYEIKAPKVTPADPENEMSKHLYSQQNSDYNSSDPTHLYYHYRVKDGKVRLNS